MSTTQNKLVQAIKEVAIRHDIDADFEYNYANQGRVYFRSGFNTLANLQFLFSHDHVTFAYSNGEREAQYFIDNSVDFRSYIKYSDGKSIHNFLEELEFAISEVTDTVGVV